ncbi:MAG: protealysin inhibitor emfourin, partial [Nocardioidaceae bacterium]
GSMADYVDTDSDNGGVHINSGIPNRAFYLAATALGGRSWDTAGPIWYAALTSGIGAGTDFAGFAAACVEAAGKVSPAAVDAVRSAWGQVGVEAGSGVSTGSTSGGGVSTGSTSGGGVSTGSTSGGSTSGTDGMVAVTRSGGFAGLQRSGMVHLGDDPRTPEVQRLLDRIDFRAVRPPLVALPDRFIYVFSVRGEEFTVGEQDLTGDLERLALVVLDD